MKAFKKHRDYGFFDQDIRLSKLSKLGDPLEKLSKGIDFETFRNILESGLEKVAKGKGGRRPFDYVMMFKILILQRYYNLSDDQIEYQINDRMSFMRFLDLTISDDILFFRVDIYSLPKFPFHNHIHIFQFFFLLVFQLIKRAFNFIYLKHFFYF